MNIVKAKRQSGRTTKLIKECAKNGGVILVHNSATKAHILSKSAQLGVCINTPILVRDIVTPHTKLAGNIYVDNAEQVFESLISKFLCSTNQLKTVVGFGDHWSDKKKLKKFNKLTLIERRKRFIDKVRVRLEKTGGYQDHEVDDSIHIFKFDRCAVGISFAPLCSVDYRRTRYGNVPLFWVHVSTEELLNHKKVAKYIIKTNENMYMYLLK